MAGNPQQQRRRRPRTRYGMQLYEKQQLKRSFGIREEQLRQYFSEAQKTQEETGPTMVTFLERRLDNAIFRAGFGDTRPQARQMASHRIFSVNGRPVNIPSYRLKVGDVVAVRENKQGKAYFTNFDKKMQNARTPSWITVNSKEFSFTIAELPTFDEANVGVDMRAVVEFFAR